MDIGTIQLACFARIFAYSILVLGLFTSSTSFVVLTTQCLSIKPTTTTSLDHFPSMTWGLQMYK